MKSCAKCRIWAYLTYNKKAKYYLVPSGIATSSFSQVIRGVGTPSIWHSKRAAPPVGTFWGDGSRWNLDRPFGYRNDRIQRVIYQSVPTSVSIWYNIWPWSTIYPQLPVHYTPLRLNLNAYQVLYHGLQKGINTLTDNPNHNANRANSYPIHSFVKRTQSSFLYHFV